MAPRKPAPRNPAQRAGQGGGGRKGGKGGKGGAIWLFLVIGAPLVLFFAPTALILVTGMIPTAVAYAADRSKEKLSAITVGAINLCGVMPFLFSLWHKGHTLSNALHTIGDPVVLLVMYTASAAGWGFYYAIPPAIANVQVMRAEMIIQGLRKTQVELVEEWGPEVSGVEEEEKAPAPPAGQ